MPRLLPAIRPSYCPVARRGPGLPRRGYVGPQVRPTSRGETLCLYGIHVEGVSEYCLGEPLTWRFQARNLIIVGLCDALVVVEPPQKSGSLITARQAADCGRD